MCGVCVCVCVWCVCGVCVCEVCVVCVCGVVCEVWRTVWCVCVVHVCDVCGGGGLQHRHMYEMQVGSILACYNNYVK